MRAFAWSRVATLPIVAATALALALAATAAPAQAAQAAQARRAAGPAGVTAAAADLIQEPSGKQVWSRGPNHQRPIASITKVMTALVVLRAGQLDRTIRVTAAAESYARAHGAGSAGLHPGDVLTARQLLEAMLLPSGADAAYLLAGAYGPGRARFIATMNATARQLHMPATHFANFDGLPYPTQRSTYSTPRALLILARAAMQRPIFRLIVGQHQYAIAATRQHHHYLWKTTNLLMNRYPGAVGIKTGFTSAAGYCLLFQATRSGRTLLGVVLDATNTNPNARFTAAARMLNWGFAQLRHGG